MALVLAGVVFILIGLERHRHGGSMAFVPIGLALVVVGARRMRRGSSDRAR